MLDLIFHLAFFMIFHFSFSNLQAGVAPYHDNI